MSSIDIRAQLVHFDRAIAETRKFQREADKLHAEERKLHRDRFLAPVIGFAAFGGASVAFFGPYIVRGVQALGH